jgi:hypothetical protein
MASKKKSGKKNSSKMSASAAATLLANASKSFGKKKPFVSRMATSTASALFGGVSRAGVRRKSKRNIANRGSNEIPLPILEKRLASLTRTVRARQGASGKSGKSGLFDTLK